MKLAELDAEFVREISLVSENVGVGDGVPEKETICVADWEMELVAGIDSDFVDESVIDVLLVWKVDHENEVDKEFVFVSDNSLVSVSDEVRDGETLAVAVLVSASDKEKVVDSDAEFVPESSLVSD